MRAIAPQVTRDYDGGMTSAFRAVSLLVFIGIALATLVPIEFRPETGHPIAERFIAFMVFGAVLVPAFPRRFGIVLLAVIVSAVSLELLQLLDPTRDGRIIDAAVKVAGGVAGCIAALALSKLFDR